MKIFRKWTDSEVCSRVESRMLLYIKLLYRLFMRHVYTNQFYQEYYINVLNSATVSFSFLYQESVRKFSQQNIKRSDLKRR